MTLPGMDSDSLWVYGRQLFRGLVRVAGVWVLLLAGYTAMPFTAESAAKVLFQLILGVVAVTLALLWQLRAVRKAREPGLRALESLLGLVGLHLVVFAAVYLALSNADQASFSEPLDHMDSLYFTTSTFATVGFGDIAAVSALARGVVTFQILVNLLLLATVGRLLFGAAKLRRQAVVGEGGGAAPPG